MSVLAEMEHSPVEFVNAILEGFVWMILVLNCL